MATILPHPTLLQSPQALQKLQEATGLVVLASCIGNKMRVRIISATEPAPARPTTITHIRRPGRTPAASANDGGDLPPCA